MIVRNSLDEIAGEPPIDPHDAVRKSTRAVMRKRFYERVAISEAPDGFSVLLDGKPIRAPSRMIVALPTRGIAEAVAQEWEAQCESLDPMTMPMTRLANSVIDGVIGREASVAEDLAKYFESDLICYRASHPAELVAREAQAWDGVLYWAAHALNARFILAEGIVHAPQPPPAVAAARAAMPGQAWPLAACHVVTTLTGSALLALALWCGVCNPDEVWSAAHIDEDYNAEQWGADEEVVARRAARRRDFDAAARVIVELRGAQNV